MWTFLAWTVSSLLMHAVARQTPNIAFSKDAFRSTVTPFRIDTKGHPYPRLHQFRRRGQNPWLGPVRYKWHAHNLTWFLDLQPYVPRSLYLRRHRHWQHWLKVFDASSPELQDLVQSGCYYTGHVRGFRDSLVGVSLCGGITGDIHCSLGNFVIHPLVNFSINNAAHVFSPLAIHDPNRFWRPLKAENINFCGVSDKPISPALEKSVWLDFPSWDNIGKPLVREKRSESRELHLEVLVVADSKMAQYHGRNLRHYILTLMATVALIYKDPSIGNDINIAVVNIALLDEAVNYDVIHTMAPITLRKFCSWQQKYNNPDDRNPSHHDAAVLITREDLCRYPGACDTLGLAQSGMMCDPQSSCAIVEDNGLSAAFTIAHELGHVLSIPHDDDRKCDKHFEQKKKLHVMARMLDYNSHPWSWSLCSRHYITSFLDVGDGHCLTDRPQRNLLQQDEEFQQPPGQLYSRDRQCQLVFGSESRICSYMPECKRLWCTMEDGSQGGCRTQHMPWADGTICDTGKYCHQGQCVNATYSRLIPVDGEWGQWKPFRKCSRTCGGGIQQAVRECDSPKPKNGGRYCTGVRVKYKPCNIQGCPLGSRDYREVQCSEFDGRRLNIPGFPPETRWVPHFAGIAPNDSCKLYCRAAASSAFFVLKEKVVDGTACSPTSFDICVNGHCEPAGCDHVLGSNKTLDRCGVCGGVNNTCREITGRFEKSVDYGYHDVVLIPPGASNIEVKQLSNTNEADDNYIVLKDPEKKYILNGDYMISMFPKTLQYHGITIDYSGSYSIVELLNTTEPLKHDLHVQVLIVGKLKPPHITFSYTVPLSDSKLYFWQRDDEFSECSHACNGISNRKLLCVRQTDLSRVSDGHCLQDLKPQQEHMKPCNQNCLLRWQDIGKSDCSVMCGQGYRQKIIKCMREDTDRKTYQTVPDELCIHLMPKPETIEQCIGSCNNSFYFTEWSQCSASCGHGTRNRKVYCMGNDGEGASDFMCSDLQRPHAEETCIVTECPKQIESQYISKRIPISSVPLYDDKPELPNPNDNRVLPKQVEKGKWKAGKWSKCSSSCGEGFRSRTLTCHHPADNSRVPLAYCNVEMKPKEQEICEEKKYCVDWKIGPWSECNCESGIKQRKVFCPAVSDNTISCNKDLRPSNEELCTCSIHIRHHRIYKWKSGPWTPCSASCGESTRQRIVVCVTHQGETVEGRKCPGNKPPTQEQCASSKCNWQWSPWTACSSSCGNGTQSRFSYCTSQKESECGTVLPSSQIRFCNTENCPIFRWKKGLWSRCSESCGPGMKIREITCVDGHRRRTDNKQCVDLKKPQKRKSCFVKLCDFVWSTSQWSDCSEVCGDGFITRKVSCHQMNDYGWADPDPVMHSPGLDSWCNINKRPKDFKHCNYGSCTKGYVWRSGPWLPCTGLCGKELQKRKLGCYDATGRKVAHRNCNHKLKPQRKRLCKLKHLSCKPQSCQDLYIQNIRTDGNFTIYVKGKAIIIYCHSMKSGRPQDYITLNNDNFAQIYTIGKKSSFNGCLLHHTIPECDCNRKDSGLTKFNKIAWNTSTLQVDTNDFTFSETYYGERVPFATAGDCFKIPQCPQGQFLVSLTGTGLRVSEHISWISQNGYSLSAVQRTEGGQKVTGRCGGYCGTCLPNPQYGLILDIVLP